MKVICLVFFVACAFAQEDVVTDAPVLSPLMLQPMLLPTPPQTPQHPLLHPLPLPLLPPLLLLLLPLLPHLSLWFAMPVCTQLEMSVSTVLREPSLLAVRMPVLPALRDRPARVEPRP